MGLLELLLVILLIAWIFGAFVVPVGTSLIHVLLLVIVVIVLVRVFRGQSL